MQENSKSNNQRPIRKSVYRIIDFGGRFINYRIGILGALFMGIVVFLINYIGTNELLSSLSAAMKQGGYTFFFGGGIMKGCEFLAISIRRRSGALISAVIIPSVITLCLTFGLHMLKGTPMPVQSTLPTLLIIPSTIVWAFNRRNNNDKLKKSN